MNVVAGYLKITYIGSNEKLSGFIEAGINFNSVDSDIRSHGTPVFNPDNFNKLGFY